VESILNHGSLNAGPGRRLFCILFLLRDKLRVATALKKSHLMNYIASGQSSASMTRARRIKAKTNSRGRKSPKKNVLSHRKKSRTSSVTTPKQRKNNVVVALTPVFREIGALNVLKPETVVGAESCKKLNFFRLIEI
jgi:hypothetical protein